MSGRRPPAAACAAGSTGSARTAVSPSGSTMTATMSRCSQVATEASANCAPMTEPTTAPMLQKPWQVLMMRRPTASWMRAASTFMATSTMT